MALGNLKLEDYVPVVKLNEGLYTEKNARFTGNVRIDGVLTSGSEVQGSEVITSTSANAFAVGPAGTTNPSFNVDASTSSAATGLNIAAAAAGGGVLVTTLSSGSAEDLSIRSKSTGVLNLNTNAAGNVNFANGTFISTTGAIVGKSTSANALSVGANAATNPVLKIDASTSSVATGISITGAAAAGGVAIAAISSGTDENLTINAKGAGTVTINGTATGNIVLGAAMTGVSSSLTGGYVAKSGTAVPASAGALAAGAPITMFSTGIKLWVTSDTPAFSATKGDLAINTGGSSSSTRLFVNNGTTNWVAITTAS